MDALTTDLDNDILCGILCWFEYVQCDKIKIKSMDFIAKSVRKCFQCFFERMDLERRQFAPTPHTDYNQRACTSTPWTTLNCIYLFNIITHSRIMMTTLMPLSLSCNDNRTNLPTLSARRIALPIWVANVLRTLIEWVIECVRLKRKFDFRGDRLFQFRDCVSEWMSMLDGTNAFILLVKRDLCWSVIVRRRQHSDESHAQTSVCSTHVQSAAPINRRIGINHWISFFELISCISLKLS